MLDLAWTDEQIKTLHALHGMHACRVIGLVPEITPEQAAYLTGQGTQPTVWIATEVMNAQTEAAGAPQWAKCANCGSVYRLDADANGTVCGKRCAAEYAAYVTNPDRY